MKKHLFLSLVITLTACGGGSSSGNSGVLVRGTLTEAGGAHSKAYSERHSDGQRIENVAICGAGECSPTDEEGQWGFVLPEDFTEEELLLTVNGHGIDSETVIHMHSATNELVVELNHVEGGVIESEVTEVDGEHHSHE